MAGFPHSQLTLSGSWVNDTNEVWAFGLQLTAADNSGPVANGQALLDACKTSVGNWFGLSTTGMSLGARLQKMTLASIDVSGATVGTSAKVLYTPAIAGGGPADAGPGFCTTAVTFKTGVNTSTGLYGRTYPPNQTSPLSGSSFKISAANAQNCANAIVRLVFLVTGGLNQASHVVVSQKTGQHNPVLVYSADTVYDTQRRRKNKISGTRSPATISPVTGS